MCLTARGTTWHKGLQLASVDTACGTTWPNIDRAGVKLTRPQTSPYIFFFLFFLLLPLSETEMTASVQGNKSKHTFMFESTQTPGNVPLVASWLICSDLVITSFLWGVFWGNDLGGNYQPPPYPPSLNTAPVRFCGKGVRHMLAGYLFDMFFVEF